MRGRVHAAAQGTEELLHPKWIAATSIERGRVIFRQNRKRPDSSLLGRVPSLVIKKSGHERPRRVFVGATRGLSNRQRGEHFDGWVGEEGG